MLKALDPHNLINQKKFAMQVADPNAVTTLASSVTTAATTPAPVYAKIF